MRANAKARQRFAAAEQGVSDVIGTILLVAITVGMMIGLSAVMLGLEGPRDRIHVEIRMSVLPGANGWGTGDETVRIEHVGGEAFPQKTARVRLGVDATTFTAGGAELGQGFADGTFSLGDTWERTQIINEGQLVEVLLIDEAGNAVTTTTRLTAKGTGSSTGGTGTGTTSGVVTYVFDGGAAKGTLTDFPAMQNGSDAGAVATLAESTAGGIASSATLDPATATSATATNPSNVKTSDDQRASLAVVGASVDAKDFTMSVAGIVITKVLIGMEAQRTTGTGADADIRLSYKIGTTTGAPNGTHTVASNSDALFTADVTTGRTWTITDINSLTITAQHVGGTRVVAIDHLFVTVEYTTVLVTDAEATFGFQGVPAGSHELQIRYRTAIETFTVQVMNATGAWNNRGTLSSPLFYSVFTHTLQPGEYRSGEPQVRLVDRDTGSLAGDLKIDYMRIDTT